MDMKRIQRLIEFLFDPPLTAPRSTLIMRLMAEGVFLSEGILKFEYTNQGVGRFTKLGIPAPEPLLRRRRDALIAPKLSGEMHRLPALDLARKG
jgi:hypothetical protein